MEINRALKRIRKKENIFFIIMGILAVLIPTLAYLANLKKRKQRLIGVMHILQHQNFMLNQMVVRLEQ